MSKQKTTAQRLDEARARKNRTISRLQAEIARLRDVLARRGNALHPHYGACDEMGADGLCAECERFGRYASPEPPRRRLTAPESPEPTP